MIYPVETPELWARVEARFREKGYKPWQYQFNIDMPEGFHVWFWSSGRETVEIVTHSAEVKNGILRYNADSKL